MQEVLENHENYSTAKKDLKQLVDLHKQNEQKIILQLKQINALSATQNSLDKKIDSLTIKKETAILDKQRLIARNLDMIEIQKENANYTKTLKGLESLTKRKRDLLNDLKRDQITASSRHNIILLTIVI